MWQGKSQLGIRKLIHKQQWKLVCGFDVGLTVLNFIVIGQYTINLSESNQRVHEWFSEFPVDKYSSFN